MRIGFPTLGVIVMGIDAGRASLNCGLSKGIVSLDSLRATVARIIALYGAAALRSDMRAHLNPTRMRAIERATVDLVRSANSHCPSCRHPAYGVVERVPGLPCSECAEPD